MKPPEIHILTKGMKRVSCGEVKLRTVEVTDVSTRVIRTEPVLPASASGAGAGAGARVCDANRPGGLPAINVGIGCLKVARRPARLAALLGSCVGLALYDHVTGLGGLAHVMLPLCPRDDPRSARYADTAGGALIDALLAAGADPWHLQAKLAGGSRLLYPKGEDSVGNVGEANIAQVKADLERRRIPVIGEDLGGDFGRKMTVFLEDFRVRVQSLGHEEGQ